MTNWKNKNKIKKAQIATAKGSQSINVQSLFEGAGVEKAQVFTLNDGIILGSTACDYSTSWSYGEKTVTIDSMAKTWDTTPILFLADVEDERKYPLYMNGKFTIITIPSGYSFYTIEASGKGTFTIYENEEPVTFELNGISKVFHTCYKQKAETVNIRVSGVNIKWAHMSSCYYFTKKTKSVKNTVVVTESVYGNFDTDKGITFPATPEGNPNPEPENPIGLLGFKDIIIEFYSMKKEGKNIASLTEFNYSDKSLENLSHLSFPHVMNIDGEINIEAFEALYYNTKCLKYLQLGTLNNPITWTNPSLKMKSSQYNDLDFIIYTKRGISFEIEIIPEDMESKVRINFKDSEVS